MDRINRIYGIKSKDKTNVLNPVNPVNPVYFIFIFSFSSSSAIFFSSSCNFMRVR